MFYGEFCEVCEMKKMKKKKKTKKLKRNFVRSYLGNGWSDFLQIWYVVYPNWAARLQQIWFQSDKGSQSYIGVKIAFSFFLLIYSRCGAPASWAARHTIVCLDPLTSKFTNKSLTYVTISQTNLTVVNANKMLMDAALSSCRNAIKFVELCKCAIDERTIQLLAKVCINKCDLPKTLKVKDCNFGSNQLRVLVNALSDVSNLKVREVDLSNIQFTSRSIDILGKLLKLLNTEILFLSNNKSFNNGVYNLLEFIKHHCINLKYLFVQGNDIVINDILGLLQQVTFDTTFSLQYFQLDDSVVVDLSNYDPKVSDYIRSFKPNKLYIKVVSSHQSGDSIISNIKDILSMFSSLECLQMSLRGDLNFDKKVLSTLQKIPDRLVIHWEKASSETLTHCKNMFDSIIGKELYSRKEIWISKSDYYLVNQTLEYIYCDIVDSLSISDTQNIPESLVDDILIRCKQLKQLSLIQCQIADHKLEKILNKIKLHSFVLTKVNLSFNELTSCCISHISEILFFCKIEVLILSGNKIEINGARSLIEELMTRLCNVKYIDMSENRIDSSELLCEEFYFQPNSDFSFIASKNGIVISKEISVKFSDVLQQIKSHFSLYLRSKEKLPSHELQNFLIKTNQMVRKLYMVLQNNTELHLNGEYMETLLASTEELCLIIPSISSESIKNILYHYFKGRNENKGIILASRETLQVKNINNENVIRKTFEYCNRRVNKIQLVNCIMSHSILNDTMHLLADSGELQLLEISSGKVEDDLLTYFNSQFSNVRKECNVQIKSVNLSCNNLKLVSVNSIITLLKCWKTEEFFITYNDLSIHGLEKLIKGSASERLSLKVLHAQHNSIEYSKAKRLSKVLFFDSESKCSIGCLRLNENNQFNILVIKPTITDCSTISKHVNDYVKVANKMKHCGAENCLFIEADYEEIDPLVYSCTSKLCVVAQVKNQEILVSKLNENQLLNEIYLYMTELTENSLSEINQNLPESCKKKLFLSTESFNVSNASHDYLHKGLKILETNCSSISTIVINHCSLDDKLLKLLHYILGNCKQDHVWQCLDVSHCSLGEKVNYILKPLPSNVTVKKLNLSHNELQQTTASVIINAVLNWSTRILKINNNDLKDTGVHKIVAEACKHKEKCQLMHLEMNKTGVTFDKTRDILGKVHKYFAGYEFWLVIDQAMLVQEAKKFQGISAPHVQILKLFYCFNCDPDIAKKYYAATSTEIVFCNDGLHRFEGAEDITATILDKTIAKSVLIATNKFTARRAHVNLMHSVLNEKLAVDEFSIMNCEINHNILQQITRLIQSNKYAHSVNLKECNLTDLDCGCLLESLNDTVDSTVATLNLSTNHITSSVMKTLVKLCSTLKVEYLYLDHNNLDDKGIKQFSLLLNETKHSLHYINFKFNKTYYMTEYEFNNHTSPNVSVDIGVKTQLISNESMLSFIEDIQQVENLYCINCSFTMQDLMHLLSLNLNRLHLFGAISNLESGPADFDEVTTITIKDIILVLKNLRDEVAKKIINTVKNSHSSIIVASKFSIFAMNCEHAELINIALRESLKYNLTFKCFSFIKCNITPCTEEFTLLLQDLQNKVWQWFKLKYCQFDDNSLQLLVESLTSARVTSRNVDLSGNLITLESTNAISKLIKGCQVEKLYLRENQISPEAIECILISSLQAHINLQEVNFELNQNRSNGQLTEDIMSTIGNEFLTNDYSHETANSCRLMVVSETDKVYFLKVQVSSIEGEVTIIGYQNSLQTTRMRVYINAMCLKSVEVLDNIVATSNFEEMYIMCEGMEFDTLKSWTQTDAAFNALYHASSAKVQSKIHNMCLKIIINSRNSKLNKLYGLQNVSVYFEVLQTEGILNVLEEFFNFIQGMSNIRVLTVKCTKEISVTCDVPSATVKIIATNPYLECINISDSHIDDSDFSKIAEKLKSISSLGSIDISKNQISNKNFDVLELILSRNTELKHLNFSNVFINQIASSASMKSLTHLTTLKVSSTFIGIKQTAIANLCKIIEINVNLEYLDLSGNKFGDDIENLFVAMKETHKALKYLNISDNQVTYRAVENISVVLQNNPNLQELDISSNELSSEDCNSHGIKSIAKTLNGKRLKKFNLVSAGIMKEDNGELSALLSKCTGLKEIDLSFGNLNVTAILSSMNHMHSLQNISLKSCNINVSDTNDLALLIKHNVQLRILDISDNSIKGEGFQRVWNALFIHHASKLKVLNVSKNDIILDSDHALKILPESKLQLAELDLSGNFVDESSYVKLFKNFIDLKYMKILNISRPENMQIVRMDNIIRELMHSATELVELDISGYAISCDVPINFWQHSKLEKVMLRNCNINDCVAVKLETYFKLDTLKHLDVSHNPINIGYLGNSVKRVNSLKLQKVYILQNSLVWILDSNLIHTLHLCGNNLEDKLLRRLKGVEQMTEILAHFLAGLHNASLKVLCLNNCRLKIKEIFRIINALQQNQNLDIVHLCNNLITDNQMLYRYKNLNIALTKNISLQELCFLSNKMSSKVIAEAMNYFAECSSSIRCIKIPWIADEEYRAKIKRDVEQIREKRSEKGNYTGLHVVFTREECQH